MAEPSAEILVSGLDELGLCPDPTQIAALLDLADLLARWSRHFNLSGHRDPDSIIRRLILDAAALQVALPCFVGLADLGSGAGFPGLPMAVLDPSCAVVLVEARERRHHFQRDAIRRLRLQNVQSLRARIEEAAPVPSDGAIAQAVGPRAQVLEWMAPWVRNGGFAAIPCGTGSFHMKHLRGWSEAEILTYQVPLGGPKRTIWVSRRK